MQIANRVPFDNPDVLFGVRSMYLASNVLIASLYLYVQSQIKQQRDHKTLKYVEPAPIGTEEPKPITTTVMDYDLSQLRALFKAQFTGLALMALMHLYFKYTNPLLIQSILPLKSALEAKLVKIHVFGQPATGDLERPFKTPQSPFNTGQEVKTDKASVKKAEEKWRGGSKDE